MHCVLHGMDRVSAQCLTESYVQYGSLLSVVCTVCCMEWTECLHSVVCTVCCMEWTECLHSVVCTVCCMEWTECLHSACPPDHCRKSPPLGAKQIQLNSFYPAAGPAPVRPITSFDRCDWTPIPKRIMKRMKQQPLLL